MAVDYKKILQLDAAGVSGRGIADVLLCSRNTVAVVVSAATARGIVYDDVAGMESAQVRSMLLGEGERVSDRVAPDLAEVHREMARPNVTLQLLWGEYAVRVTTPPSIRSAYPPAPTTPSSGAPTPTSCPPRQPTTPLPHCRPTPGTIQYLPPQQPTRAASRSAHRGHRLTAA